MNISVLGAGNSGLAMAAHLTSEGHCVTLWNRNSNNVKKLLITKTIYCTGVLNEPIKLNCVTANMNEAIKESELILITTPANSHEDLAYILANELERSIPIILNPGRTFGALRFTEIFKQNNNKVRPIVAETQTIIYTCRKIKEDSVSILSLKKSVPLATIYPDKDDIFCFLPDCLKNFFVPAKSVIETSLGNVGMVLHCAPLLLNAGWTENNNRTYKYYYDGITERIGEYIEKIDVERINVSEKLGHKVESTKDWLKRTYKVEGDSIFQCIQNNKVYKTIDAPTSLLHRYIYEDVSFGLVPLESMGIMLGVDMSYTTLTIDLANALMQCNFRNSFNDIDIRSLTKAVMEI